LVKPPDYLTWRRFVLSGIYTGKDAEKHSGFFKLRLAEVVDVTIALSFSDVDIRVVKTPALQICRVAA
jgi:hypothetical protein